LSSIFEFSTLQKKAKKNSNQNCLVIWDPGSHRKEGEPLTFAPSGGCCDEISGSLALDLLKEHGGLLESYGQAMTSRKSEW